MKNSKVLKAILLVTGLPLTVMGSWRVFDPVSFYAFSGMTLDPSINILSEARGAGGVVAGFGLLILSGIFVKKASLHFIDCFIYGVLFVFDRSINQHRIRWNARGKINRGDNG